MTTRGLLNNVKGILTHSQIDRMDARILLAHALKKSTTWLIAHDTDTLTIEQVNAYWRLHDQRLSGMPVAYLVGHKEFMGHTFIVTPDTLIPRPDTELLVETALECVEHITAPRILDMGTGSGAIALSIALARPDAHIVASDISDKAIQVARLNAQQLGANNTRFCSSDWFKQIPTERFDLIISNPPYIDSQDHHLTEGDLRFEPPHALTDFKNGLSAIEHIIQTAPKFLKPDSMLWLEHGWDQAPQVRALLRNTGFTAITSRLDLASIERISGGLFSY